jgi:hypothetical protein
MGQWTSKLVPRYVGGMENTLEELLKIT